MIKQDIERIIKFCCKELDLPVIKIKITEETYWIGSFTFGEGVRLEFNLERLGCVSAKDNKHLIKLLNYKFRNNKEMVFFVIAHELGHYLQYSRHKKWMLFYLDEVEKYLYKLKRFNHIKYNRFKLERNANKIALILLKRAKKKGFKI